MNSNALKYLTNFAGYCFIGGIFLNLFSGLKFGRILFIKLFKFGVSLLYIAVDFDLFFLLDFERLQS